MRLLSESTLADISIVRQVFIVVIVMVAITCLTLLSVLGAVVNLWFQARAGNAPVSVAELIGMRFRKVDARVIVYSRIRLAKAGLNISSTQLETHYLAGGRVPQVVNALIDAGRTGVPLSFDDASAIDLAGRDVLYAVRQGKIPKLAEIPRLAPGSGGADQVG